MNKPKTNWHLKAKKLEGQNKDLNNELNRISDELKQVEKSYEKSKQVWSR